MLDFIDFRNIRFQGDIHNHRPHGIGIFDDQNGLFCIAKWSHGQIHGSVFIIFPDSKIFCGRIINRQLDGICCCYTKDNHQIYLNYSSEKDKSKRKVITILPFYRLILQIHNNNGQQPTITKFDKYGQESNALSQKLSFYVQKDVNFKPFQSWLQFLKSQFAQSNCKKLYWKEKESNKNRKQYFIGFKSHGMGIKFTKMQTFQDSFNKECIIVNEMGNFDQHQQLKGYGRKLIDLKNQLYQQGIFQNNYSKQTFVNNKYEKNMIQNQKLAKIFLQQLKKSTNFINEYYNIDYLYDLNKMYTTIKIQQIEETQKIAQVIIQRQDSNKTIIAEIQNVKMRKKTPVKSGQQNKYSSYLSQFSNKTKFDDSKNNKKLQTKKDEEEKEEAKRKMFVNAEYSLKQVKQHICNSIEKIKTYKRNSICKQDHQKKIQTLLHSSYQKIPKTHHLLNKSQYKQSQIFNGLKVLRQQNKPTWGKRYLYQQTLDDKMKVIKPKTMQIELKQQFHRQSISPNNILAQKYPAFNNIENKKYQSYLSKGQQMEKLNHIKKLSYYDRDLSNNSTKYDTPKQNDQYKTYKNGYNNVEKYKKIIRQSTQPEDIQNHILDTQNFIRKERGRATAVLIKKPLKQLHIQRDKSVKKMKRLKEVGKIITFKPKQ